MFIRIWDMMNGENEIITAEELDEILKIKYVQLKV